MKVNSQQLAINPKKGNHPFHKSRNGVPSPFVSTKLIVFFTPLNHEMSELKFLIY